ncbi:MAG: response regulator receiver protein [Coxiellaceae bacterium]|nr:response regulator receiver protein [Coxiellaceae bacterium]|tara:strand:+ start:1647 stop:1904 length:258 start_codon:yes stop_codon:yes gene_type:complete
MSESESFGLQQVRWMARRGMLELDLLFNRFVDAHFLSLSIEEQVCLVDLLQEQDTTLYDWFFSTQQPEREDFVSLVSKIKHVQSV